MAQVGVSLSSRLLSKALLLLVLTGACSRGGPPPGAEGPPPGTPVKLQNVETSLLEESDQYNGKLEANRRVELKPEIDGRVSQIFVSAGSRVAVGTPIVQLSPEKSQAEVGAAVANVNAARAQRNSAEAEVRALEAERSSAQANVELQNEQYRRISGLVSQGALARERLDQVTRDRNSALASLKATEERIRAARANLDQANATLQESQSNATLRSENLKDTKVLSPLAGIVGDFSVKPGTYVQAGDTLTTIIQNDTLNLDIQIPSEKTSELRIGLPVQLLDQNKQPLGTGRISFISPQVNTQQILAKASFPNPEGTLRDGQIAIAKVIWERNPGVLVPTTAVTRVAGQPFVYVAEPQEGSKMVAKQKRVELGEIQGNNYQVIQGLKPGERIIISGIQNLSDGAPIIPES